MTILAIEGYDHYTTGATGYGELGDVESYAMNGIVGSNGIIDATNTPYSSGKSLALKYSRQQTIALDISDGEMYVGFNYMISSQVQENNFIGPYDASGGESQCYLAVTTANQIKAYRYSGAAIGTSTLTLTPDVWYWIEVYFKVANSPDGVITVKVNGTDYLTLTSVDTLADAATPYIAGLKMYCTNGARTNYYDDLVIQDSAGDFIGASRIETFMPAADNTVAWSRSAGSTNYENIDEIGLSDADYVYSVTASQTDLYDVGALSADDTIHAVGIHTRAKKDATGARSIESRTKSGASEQGGVDKSLALGFVGYTDVFETYNGSGAWTKTLFDAAQFGIKVTV